MFLPFPTFLGLNLLQDRCDSSLDGCNCESEVRASGCGARGQAQELRVTAFDELAAGYDAAFDLGTGGFQSALFAKREYLTETVAIFKLQQAQETLRT